jgi:3-hydroxyacyl-CoA dehydrogenase
VTVFGAGLMGAGIAQVLAHKGGYNVTLADVTDKALGNGQKIISKSLTRIAKKSMSDKSEEEQANFVKSVVDSINITTDAGKAVEQTDLVIEAIIENVGVKQELFKFLDGKAPKETIFASNTSSLSVTDIAQTSSRKDRFGGEYLCSRVDEDCCHVQLAHC